MATKETDRKELKATDREPMLRPRSSVTEMPDGNIVLRLEMPGVARENLEIGLEPSELSITGRRPSATGNGQFLIKERPRGSFHQVYTLDDTIDPAKIDAVLEGGVLTVTLHRREAVRPRKITVRT
jgi:HSP20 family protein